MKKSFRLSAGLALATLCALGLAGRASAQQPLTVLFTVDENGNGIAQSIHASAPMPGGLAPDPGPGGSPLALTYPFSVPVAVVPGDVVMFEPGVEGVSDLIRFNPGSSDFVTPASLVFYSDSGDGIDSLADLSAFPTADYQNTVFKEEVGPEGLNGLLYIPGPSDPGFVYDDVIHVPVQAEYQIISDVPEPGSLALLATGGLPLLGFLRRRRLIA